MKRLIIVPQLPVQGRYQEWWVKELPENLSPFFDDIVVLGALHVKKQGVESSQFSDLKASINFEMQQIKEFMELDIEGSLWENYVLLTDISYPGIFANVLFHYNNIKVYAIAHATSLNKGDYFERVRDAKCEVEFGLSALCEKVFVATEYHKQKLSWPNVKIIGLPAPPDYIRKAVYRDTERKNQIFIAGRNNWQKRDERRIRFIKNLFPGYTFVDTNFHSWDAYFTALKESKVMLITAREETFGYQALDAFYSNTIVVAPDCCAYPEILEPTYLYNPEDLMDLRSKMETALNANSQIALIKENAAELIQNFYKRLAYEIVNR